MTIELALFREMFFKKVLHFSYVCYIYYSNCTLPDCWCSSDGTLVPGGLSPTDVPQMVTITFDDAINDENWRLYNSRLFPPTRKNPNGCPVNFVSLYIKTGYIKYFQFEHTY